MENEPLITRNCAPNKTNAKTVEGFSEEGLNDCILLTLVCDHLSEESLDNFDMSQAFSKIPAGLLTKYHDTTSITCRVVNEFSDDVSNPVIEEGSDDLQAVLRQQPQLQLDTLSEFLEQAYAVLGAQIKDLNKSNNRDPALIESVIQDVKNITSKIENTRHPYQHPPRQRR